ncbi:preprotein translocase subunit SecA [Candidatus Gottesmanbacteria bacterium RIFCSPLOWO2_01_FULL_43_11b]|uniref:Protein translocase subunit SecA n=1 Tax=Candidatus Gottesmanbacteria bacterium RIFCSPLOWO2_01_FULL_43_11b TaxID=1798392 RepID=A0A1F6AI18_9BACT|nr:MAG: preprotein translocase subunit SecA [Candidatus Gottesmanbacteria bacterium RIFCSPLOWO2_01_FULL_43_11b]
MFKFLTRLLDTNEKEVSRIRKSVERINEFEGDAKKVKTADFTKKTAEFRERLTGGQQLDELVPEAYALVREAAFRTIGERHYDVQLVAALALHEGKVAEQKTGEGKTLSATPALYINALSGRGAHLVTVNDYLARRDAGWMGPVYHVLGLKVAAMINDQSFLYDPQFEDKTATDWRLKHLRPITRKEAYLADITYGINSEFGFDYLRDNMARSMDQLVQREYHYAIIDEVDSILIDEARTPHIISAPAEEATHKYYDYAKIVEKLSQDTDFVIDEKLRTAHLTDHGILKIEKMMGLGNIYETDFETVHHIEAALKAKTLYHREKEYIVKEGQVIIVDEFTGRLLTGRRFSEGIHQAIEAKEGVAIQQESKTLATVSLQNYFRMYQKLAGMTGTAATEAEEFKKIYNLDVLTIPTHRPMVRQDNADSVYKTTRAKYAAVVNDIIEHHKRGQPVLVGTTSIDKNEIISEFLKRKGIPHEVLNAKNHLREAMIISDAGKKGAVTVATNMAGRGVDIILGGAKKEKWEYEDEKEWERDTKEWQKRHDDVVNFGGLHVIGTERHESRRIDNQLRGRSGRQGDPGSSRFYVSLEDEIMKLFGGDQVARLMTAFKMPEDVPLEHAMVSRAIEQAQVKVEGFHFDSRKHLVDYDDVLNKQREIVYKRRRKILEGENQKEKIIEKISGEIANVVAIYAEEKEATFDRQKIVTEFVTIIPFDDASAQQLTKQLEQLHTSADITDFLMKVTADMYEAREKQVTPEILRQVEQWVSLQVIDNLWMEHLDAIDDLREGIGLRGYGQRDPLVEYKNEAFNMFERLISSIDSEIVHRIFKVQVQLAPQAPRSQVPTPAPMPVAPQGLQPSIVRRIQTNAPQQSVAQPVVNSSNKLGRNDPCWCGSGKKWKKCHYPQAG